MTDESAVEALADAWAANYEWGRSSGYNEGREDQLDACEQELRDAIAADKAAGRLVTPPVPSPVEALAAVIEEVVPGDLAAWRYRYSEAIARAVIAAGWSHYGDHEDIERAAFAHGVEWAANVAALVEAPGGTGGLPGCRCRCSTKEVWHD